MNTIESRDKATFSDLYPNALKIKTKNLNMAYNVCNF